MVICNMLQFKCSLNTVTVKRDTAKWFAQLKIEKQHDRDGTPYNRP